MKVVHFECGLGNQMTCYANYLLVKENNPKEEIYIENLVYTIDRCNMGIFQWNGFELENVFGLEFKDVVDVVKDKNLLLKTMENEYKKNGGHNNSVSAVNALNKCGMNLKMIGYNPFSKNNDGLKGRIRVWLGSFITQSSKSYLGYSLKKMIYTIVRKIKKPNPSVFNKRSGNYFYPLSFDVMKDIHMLDKIKDKIKRDFVFPAICDNNNLRISRLIQSTNSVSVHARRSDFLQYNNDCYRFGYFKKSVKYIKSRIKNPVFFVFSDDSEWCQKKLKVLGLNKNDIVYFIDWNKDINSYRDMQLMSMCKHNIITKSSFGWWASYLNKNPQKIIVSQVSEYYSKKYY